MREAREGVQRKFYSGVHQPVDLGQTEQVPRLTDPDDDSWQHWYQALSGD